jgi:hypothetical protein
MRHAAGDRIASIVAIHAFRCTSDVVEPERTLLRARVRSAPCLDSRRPAVPRTNVEKSGFMQSRSGRTSAFAAASRGALAIAALLATASVARAADANCSGTVINLSCDSVRPSGGVARCDPGDPVLALAVNGRELRPLVLAGGPVSVEQLRAGAFTGRQVRVVGTCPPSGTIHVEEVIPLG